jgi:hypothetical protein
MKCLIILMLGLHLISCNEANPRAIKSWFNSSDTLVQQMMMKEQPILDSICKAKSEAYYRAAYDSIYQRRLVEIKLLLDSIPANERSR